MDNAKQRLTELRKNASDASNEHDFRKLLSDLNAFKKMHPSVPETEELERIARAGLGYTDMEDEEIMEEEIRNLVKMEPGKGKGCVFYTAMLITLAILCYLIAHFIKKS